VFEKAARARLEEALARRSKDVEKKARAVFLFLSLNQPVLDITTLDSLHLRNECIGLLRDVIVALVQQGTVVDFDAFLDLLVERELLQTVEEAYQFVTDPDPLRPSPVRRLRKTESLVSGTLTNEFDRSVRKVFKESIAPKVSLQPR
jgi:hypothetical protein